MRPWMMPLLLFPILGLGGCGSEKSPYNATTPLTEDQGRSIRVADKAVDDAERSGGGTATPVKRKR